MASELQTIDSENGRAKVPVVAGAKLAAFIPQTIEEAFRLSKALALSGMTPKSYGSDEKKILVGIMAGAEVGLTPMAALQSIAVIGNNPALWGDGALGLIQASGLLEDMEETDDGSTATCTMRRKGRTTPIRRSFSMDDAKKAGLAGKSGPWTQYPARMRQMRARAFAMRDGFADVLRGLHIAEEARDYVPLDGGALSAAEPLTGQALLDQANPDHPAAGDGSLADDGPFNKAEDAADSAKGSTALLEALADIASAELVADVNSRVVRYRNALPKEADAIMAAGTERIIALQDAA